MIPTPKAPEIEREIDNLLPAQLLGRRNSIELDQCVLCCKPVNGFRDELSCREFTISGMCQACQDRVFEE